MSNPKLRVAFINQFDSASLSTSPTPAARTAVEYLQQDGRAYVLQAAAVGAQIINGNWGGAVAGVTMSSGQWASFPISCLVIHRHNLVNGDTIRLQLYSDLAQTAQVSDSTAVAAISTDLFSGTNNWAYSYGFSSLYFSPVSNVKSFRITITSSVVQRHSRIFLGPYTEVSSNPKFGFQLGPASNSTQERWDGGTLGANAGGQWRTSTFDLFFLTEADRSTWNFIGAYCDVVKSVWLSLYPGQGGTRQRDHEAMGKFEKNLISKLTTLSQWDLSVNFNEI